jgi:hypothetical protein
MPTRRYFLGLRNPKILCNNGCMIALSIRLDSTKQNNQKFVALSSIIFELKQKNVKKINFSESKYPKNKFQSQLSQIVSQIWST